jgi:hypothetical protein
LRVPYATSAATQVDTRLDGFSIGDRALLWPVNGGAVGRYVLGNGIPLYARVVSDAERDQTIGSSWERVAVVARDGVPVASVRRGPDGSLLLPFDPNEACLMLLSERYAGVAQSRRGLKRGAMRAYYRFRPAMPRSFQIWLRRRYSVVQARTAFPRWPAETALDDLQHWLLASLAAVAGEPVPWLRPWPQGRAWALVLTHDVETLMGLGNIAPLRGIEESLGLRSSWNFVPRRYEVPDELVRSLVDDGFEVGVHGLYHDGRDLESLATLRARLPAMRSYAERWGAVGFRSPATHRRWEWMSMLGFEYDSSYPDTDPFEPQGGGCCSFLPYFNEDMVELPITLAQDHTLFVILQEESDARWIEKTELLRQRGGMALLNVHPDYMLEPHRLAVYRRYLERYAGDSSLWHALPREVNAWWRRRSRTFIERRNGHWVTAGEGADEASVALAEPSTATP